MDDKSTKSKKDLGSIVRTTAAGIMLATTALNTSGCIVYVPYEVNQRQDCIDPYSCRPGDRFLFNDQLYVFDRASYDRANSFNSQFFFRVYSYGSRDFFELSIGFNDDRWGSFDPWLYNNYTYKRPTHWERYWHLMQNQIPRR